jgi:hypothetical protein
MSDKIKPHHLERKAILYIRQSSLYQVNHNLESQKLQYAMEARLQQLGWREIEVVDDDLGRSAAGTVTRAGFERMVAEVCMGKVGAVARNSREWQQLIEVCRDSASEVINVQLCCKSHQRLVSSGKSRWEGSLLRSEHTSHSIPLRALSNSAFGSPR